MSPSFDGIDAVIEEGRSLAPVEASVQEGVGRVEHQVGALLRLMRLERVGDVVGCYRTVSRIVTSVSAGQPPTSTDWDAVSDMRPDLQILVERLRHHARSSLKKLEPREDLDERARQLRSVVHRDMVGQSLMLLLVSEAALFKWQRLRLQWVLSSEPLLVDKTVQSVHHWQRLQLASDERLIDLIALKLVHYGHQGCWEIHRPWSRDSVRRDLAQLWPDVSTFAAARHRSLGPLPTYADPTLREAWGWLGYELKAPGAGALALAKGVLARPAHRLLGASRSAQRKPRHTR